MNWLDSDSLWIAFALVLAFVLLGSVAGAARYVRRRRRLQLPPTQRPSAARPAAAPAPEPLRPDEPRRAPALIKRVTHTRHPIVLAHGWGGLEAVLPVQLGYSYFRGIPETLRSRGHVVHVASVSPTASIELRARQLARQIERLGGRVNIIAHSMGGLDARLAIARLGIEEHVASLTTIGTPHHGTPLADMALLLGEWRRSRGLLNRLGVNIDGVYDVSTARMKEFNQQVPDVPGVLYTNVVAAVDIDAGRVHAMLQYGHRYLLRTAGANDGIVPALSQVWGETLEEVDADHWAQIGWFAQFDVPGLYGRIVRRLAEREL